MVWNTSGEKNLPVVQLALKGKTAQQLYLRSELSIKAVTDLGFSPVSISINPKFSVRAGSQ